MQVKVMTIYLKVLLYFCTYEGFVCLNICASPVSLVPLEVRRGHLISWNQSYGWLWATKCMLGTELNHWVHSYPLAWPKLSNKKTIASAEQDLERGQVPDLVGGDGTGTTLGKQFGTLQNRLNTCHPFWSSKSLWEVKLSCRARPCMKCTQKLDTMLTGRSSIIAEAVAHCVPFTCMETDTRLVVAWS